MRMTIAVLALILALVAQSAAAHPHTLDPDEDGVTLKKGNGDPVQLANGQLHTPFEVVEGSAEACGGDHAAYGLETAHHGPDEGTAGNGDGCYLSTEYTPVDNPTTGTTTIVPTDDNPAIN
jgi:hypothetical protein